VISPYRSVVIDKSENKIHFVGYDEDKQQHLENYYAYAEPVIDGHYTVDRRTAFGSAAGSNILSSKRSLRKSCCEQSNCVREPPEAEDH
jgi:hypothetical protein